jgi:RNA polymerase sigma-70 factor, ECF subfamily
MPLKIQSYIGCHLIGKGRAFALVIEGKDNMETTEAYIGSEQPVEVRMREREAQEMRDVLSRYLPSFHRRAYRYLGNAADAEDAVQDALLSAYTHLDQFKGQAQLSTWLTTIVTNSARMQLRRRPRQIHVSIDEQLGEDQEYTFSELLADDGPSPEDACRHSELRGRLEQLATKLSPPLRKTFQLHDLNGLNTSETAHILRVAEGTVKAQLARARAKLRRLMERALDPQPHARRNCTTLPNFAAE